MPISKSVQCRTGIRAGGHLPADDSAGKHVVGEHRVNLAETGHLPPAECEQLHAGHPAPELPSIPN